ncbi:response regulator [Labilibacter sediminis]|nr:response regulator [Labilibacter sediminis]
MLRMPLLFAVLFCFCCNSIFSSSNKYRFGFLSVEDGLSHNEVTSIVQDHYGFMWFGTRGGLNRYDGYEFKHYKPSVVDSNSLSNPSIENLYLNSSFDINIGLKSGGPSKYVVSKEVFEKINIPKQYSINRILSFFEDSKGNTWIGSWSNGVLCIKQDTVMHYPGLNQVREIAETEDETIWIASSVGLKYKKTTGNQFINFGGGSVTAISVDSKNSCLWALGWTQELMKVNYKTLRSEVFINQQPVKVKNFCMLNDSHGKLWIGTWGNGLFLFDKKKKEFQKIDIYPPNHDAAPVDFNVIRVIYEDNVGDVWLGTQAGIVRLSSKNNFKSVGVIDNLRKVKTHISAVLVDEDGRTWVGTNGNGLYYSDDKITFNKVKTGSIGVSDHVDNLSVKAINIDPDKRIWISLERGVYIIAQDKSSEPYLITAESYFDDHFKQVKKVHQFYFDNNQLWIATQQSGVYLFKKEDNKYRLVKHFTSGPGTSMLQDDRVTFIKKDFKGNMWFATYKGLYKLNPNDLTFSSLADLGIVTPLACDILLNLELDKNGNLWFGTPCGLYKLDLNRVDRPKLLAYNKDNGLADDYINGILVSDDGLIWCSTNAGISSLNPESNQLLNFDKADGLGDASFSEGACYKDKKGNLYFGGYSALTFFNPKEIKKNNYNPSVVISNFSILNNEVSVNGSGSILNKTINEISRLELGHKELEFSFKVASLDYKAPHKNQYAYRLQGHDLNWINIRNQRNISFSNLKPGDYKLQIKATNSNGIWSKHIKSIELSVLPAPWKSKYAIIGYVMLIMGFVGVILWVNNRQERLQSGIEMEKMHNEQIKKINDFKLRFFTNISHEFRTPLTLILAPVKELMSKDFSEINPAFFNERIGLIGHSTTRLYNLVNQLLEFRKMDSGKITLKVSQVNLQELIEENSEPFRHLAKNKLIRFRSDYNSKDTLVYVDSERMTIVISNLLSNAFKHVTPKGKVWIQVTDESDQYCISVKNEGQPISVSEIDHLFERFYQGKGDSSIGSSGIGLNLVKSFTELHKGKVHVSNDPEGLIVFSVYLKKGKDHFTPAQLEDNTEFVDIMPDHTQIVPKATVNTGTKGATVLIVEDNEEVRNYLLEIIGEYYQVIEAQDGFQGFEKVIGIKPDLVLSDVMMPGMDGYELCEKIKTNDLISDIPVVLLTAKGSDVEQLLGAKKGADLYIKKPFVPDLLLEEVKQLIATRKKLKQKYSSKVVLESKHEEITSSEARFLDKAIEALDKHLNKPDFTPEALAKELAMSSSTLYRKIKKATDQSPSSFIKTIRLKKAAKLLKESDLTVSEVVESVGYLDIRNFRKNFREVYNLSPSEYRTTYKS